MTKDLTEDTRKTLFRNIKKGRGTVLAIRILLAEEDNKKDLNRKNFSEALKDLRDLSNCIRKKLWNDITGNLKDSTLNKL
jgi:ribonuclease HII